MRNENARGRAVKYILFGICAAIAVAAAVFFLSHILYLKSFSDYLSVSYADSLIPYESYENFSRSENAKEFSGTAAWKKEDGRNVSVEASGRSTQASCYSLVGQAEAVFGDTLAEGYYFTGDENDVCLIDTKLAEELFGARHVLGRELMIGGETYKITGRLEGNEKMCVIPAGKTGTFEGVTVRKKEASQSTDNAVSILAAYFGGTAAQIVDGQLYYILSLIRLAGIIFAAAVTAGTVFIIVKGRKAAGGIVLAAGLCLTVYVISMTPFGNDYLPTYWSDLDFYGNLWEEKSEQIRELKFHQEFWHEERFLRR